VESEADIKNTALDGYAISNSLSSIYKSGTVTINGGTISSIYNYGTVTINGGTISAYNYRSYAISNGNTDSLILGGSPDITGKIKAYAEKLSVIASGDDVFSPGNKKYELEFDSYSNNMIAVQNGAAFADNFTLTNSNWGLAAEGDNLVIVPTHTVTFADWNNTVLKTQTVNQGSAATAPTAPTREGYTFKDWNVAFNNITSDLTIKAEYTINNYTVTFVNWNSTVLRTYFINHGSAATASTAPAREGYTFTGWDADYSNITSNLTVTAVYEEITSILNPIAKGSIGIVQKGESFQIVGTSQATPISIYNLQGKVFMTRTAMPNESISVAHLPKGVYVVKAGGEMVKVVK